MSTTKDTQPAAAGMDVTRSAGQDTAVDRTDRAARLFALARRALGTEDEAREFLMAPHPELDGLSPIDAAGTEPGACRVQRILRALEYGLAL